MTRMLFTSLSHHTKKSFWLFYSASIITWILNSSQYHFSDRWGTRLLHPLSPWPSIQAFSMQTCFFFAFFLVPMLLHLVPASDISLKRIFGRTGEWSPRVRLRTLHLIQSAQWKLWLKPQNKGRGECFFHRKKYCSSRLDSCSTT